MCRGDDFPLSAQWPQALLAASGGHREAPAAPGDAVETRSEGRGGGASHPAESRSGSAAIALTSDMLSTPSRASSDVLGAFSPRPPQFLKAFLVLNSRT